MLSQEGIYITRWPLLFTNQVLIRHKQRYKALKTRFKTIAVVVTNNKIKVYRQSRPSSDLSSKLNLLKTGLELSLMEHLGRLNLGVFQAALHKLLHQPIFCRVSNKWIVWCFRGTRQHKANKYFPLSAAEGTVSNNLNRHREYPICNWQPQVTHRVNYKGGLQ